jgi:transcription initiation factor IIE alpha subunit
MTNKALVLEAVRDLTKHEDDATEERIALYTGIAIPQVRRALLALERAHAVQLTRAPRSSRWPCLGGMPTGDIRYAEPVNSG